MRRDKQFERRMAWVWPLCMLATLAAAQCVFGQAGTSQYIPITPFGRSVVDDTSAAAALTTLGIDSDDAVTFGRNTISGDSAAYGTAANALTVTGLTSQTRTETVANNSRPVAWSMTATASPSSALGQATDFHGLDIVGATTSTNLNSNAQLYPFESTASYSAASGNLDAAVAGYFHAINQGVATLSEAVGVRIWTRNTGAGTLTDAKGVLIETPQNSGGGTLSTAYGIYIEPHNTATNNYAIYNAGGDSYFAGDVEIVGDSAAYGTAEQSLDVIGLVELDRTETATNQARPVAWSMETVASPGSALGQSTDYHGLDIVATTASTNLNSNGSIYALESTASYAAASGSLDRATAAYFQTNHQGAATMSEGVGLQVWNRNSGAGVLTDSRGILIKAPTNTGGGSITTSYGLYIESHTAATTDYAIYSAGGANYFAGTVEIADDATLRSAVPSLVIDDSTTAIASNEYLLNDIAFEGSDVAANTAGRYVAIEAYALDTNANAQGSAGEGGRFDVSIYRHDSGGAVRTKYTPLQVSYDTATVNGSLNFGTSELTIASGVVTSTRSYHTVDTEGDGASDDLVTINGGAAGDVLIITAADSARTVVVKDGTGNLQLVGDCTLDNAQDSLTLIYSGSAWLETSRSDNGA